MLYEVLLSNRCELGAFGTVCKILLFLFVQAILFLLLEVLATLLLSHLTHTVSHYLIVVVVAIGGDVSGVLVSKFKMSSFEILFRNLRVTAFGRKSWSKCNFGGCVLSIEVVLAPSDVEV